MSKSFKVISDLYFRGKGEGEKTQEMGNSWGRKTTKVMKIDGETMKLRTPIRAVDILKDYPGYVILESESVKNLGLRSKPLEDTQNLKPKRLYFLVELPKVPDEKAPRRVRSGGIHMSAKDRLESLMLSRRSVSDLTLIKAPTVNGNDNGGDETLRLKMRLPKSQVTKLVEESKDSREAAAKIMELATSSSVFRGTSAQDQRSSGSGTISETCKPRQKRVGFAPLREGEMV